MTELVVRRLLIDLQTPFAARLVRRRCLPFRLLQCLVDELPGRRAVLHRLGAQRPEGRAGRSGSSALAAEVQGFIGQEATHRRLHALFNGHLESAQGLRNTIAGRAPRRIRRQAHRRPRLHRGRTAATEHLTALFADWLLRHPEALDGAEPRLKTAVDVAQRRRVRAPQHRLRRLPGARRQPRAGGCGCSGMSAWCSSST
jgi:hypothetical protein